MAHWLRHSGPSARIDLAALSSKVESPGYRAMTLGPGAFLRDTDLSDHDLNDLDLSGSRIDDCTLTDAILSGTSFEGARFLRCRFIRCRFVHADFRDAAIEACDFTDDAGHQGPEFSFCRLDQAKVVRSDLSFARLDRCEAFGLEMETCNLLGAKFSRVDFSRAFGRKVVKAAGALRGCNLDLADLTELRAPECDFSASRFRESVLIDADLDGADLRGCDLFQALMAGARLRGADIRGAQISGLNLNELAGFEGLKVSADQQHLLLSALGVDVAPV